MRAPTRHGRRRGHGRVVGERHHLCPIRRHGERRWKGMRRSPRRGGEVPGHTDRGGRKEALLGRRQRRGGVPVRVHRARPQIDAGHGHWKGVLKEKSN